MRSGIIILQAEDYRTIPGLAEVLEEMKPHSNVKIKTDHIPAVIGEFAGMATEIVLSDYSQALLNAAALGAILWKAIELIKKAGKRIVIGKEIVLPLVASKAEENFEDEFSAARGNEESIRVWGPMAAELTDGPFSAFDMECEQNLGEEAYFMAMSVALPRNRVKTIYYILGGKGEILSSWTTQTFSERVPDFLRPNMNSTSEQSEP